MRSYIQNLHDSLKRDGFTLMAESKPNVGHDVEAVRIFVRRGFGGVILSTSRKIVPVTRTSEYDYQDTLNNDQCVYSEFEAWRELQTYKKPDSVLPRPGDAP
jgi:hypothetical protein